MTTLARGWLALATLAAILAITVSWWALALWPVETTAPVWLLRTREVCFGATSSGLPDAGGWILLVGQPLGMLALLCTVWWADVRAAGRLALSRVTGQVAVGVAAAAIVAGLWGVAVRVARADSAIFSAGDNREIASQLNRLHDEAPALTLIDQHSQVVSLDAFRGRPVLVTFGYSHCETVCPMVVADVLAASRSLVEEAPVVLIVTLDPWRDTPSRLGDIASGWHASGDERVLSGPPDVVERTLNAWRVPRVRNEKTGDISHPSMVYVVGPDGRIAYVVSGGAAVVTAAVRAL